MKLMNRVITLAVVFIILGLSACAKKPPVKLANEKTGTYEEKQLTFGGKYLVEDKDLVILVNGDAVLSGSFPPFTPKMNLKTDYDGLNIEADCYFGSVLTSSVPGVGGVIAGIVQSQEGVSADKCEIFVQGESAHHLYFQLTEQS